MLVVVFMPPSRVSDTQRVAPEEGLPHERWHSDLEMEWRRIDAAEKKTNKLEKTSMYCLEVSMSTTFVLM